LAHHTVLFPADHDAEFDAVFRDRVPVPDPTILVTVADDPAVRPDGYEAWFVLVNAPPQGPVDWTVPGLADRYADHVLAVVARRGRRGYPSPGRCPSAACTATVNWPSPTTPRSSQAAAARVAVPVRRAGPARLARPARTSPTATTIPRVGRSATDTTPISRIPAAVARARRYSCSQLTPPAATTSQTGVPSSQNATRQAASPSRSATESYTYPSRVTRLV